MRRKLKFILFILILIVGIEVSAQALPKPLGPPKPEFPIDEELPILILIATVFGIYRIYRLDHKTIKKPL